MAKSEIANVEQAEAWNGGDGEHWTTHDDHHNAATRAHFLRMIDAARIQPDDRVLDIGCGCGESTRAAARLASSGAAVGVDLSGPMLDRARELSRAEGLTNVSFEQGDAQVFPFKPGEYSAAISRFGAMFFGDPLAAFTNIAGALRPGAQMTIVAWQDLMHNEWLRGIRGALAAGRDLPAPPVGAPGMLGLADADASAAMFRAAGFRAVDFAPIDDPMCLGTDADDAFAFVSSMGITQGALRDLDDAARTGARDALRATVDAHDTGNGVLLGAGVWLITATRA